MEHAQDLFRFVGIRPALKNLVPNLVDAAAIVGEGAPGHAPLVLNDAGNLEPAVRVLVADPDFRPLVSIAELDCEGLRAAAALYDSDSTVRSLIDQLAANPANDINATFADPAFAGDRFRAAATILGVHYDLLDEADLDPATWTLGFSAVLGEVMSGTVDLDVAVIEEIKKFVFKVPPHAAAPGKALARDPAVGELLLVRERLVGYHMGEIAAIENVMATETRDHRVKREEIAEQRVETESDRDVSTEQESSINERSELQSEIAKSLSQQWSVHGDLRYETKLGPATKLNVDVGGSFSSASSESSKSASTFAKETTEKSVKRIRERSVVRRSSLTRTTVVDDQHRGFVNPGPDHRTGIYRWVESDWEATLHNYGQRLLLEFLIPEPGNWLSAARRTLLQAELDITEPHPPEIQVTDATGKGMFDADGRPLMRPLQLSDLEPWTYARYLADYMVQGGEAPPYDTVVTASIKVGDGVKDKPEQLAQAATADNVKVPDGFEAYKCRLSLLSWERDESHPVQMTAQVSIAGRHWLDMHQRALDVETDLTPPISGNVSIAVWTDLARGVVGTVKLTCRPTTHAMVAWRQRTYELIVGAYAEARQVYEARRSSAVSKREADVGSNALNLTKSHILNELKKHVVGMLNPGRVPPGDRPLGLAAIAAAVHANETPAWADVIASKSRDVVGFLEQAIEWSTLQYVAYPYFWTAAERWDDRFVDSFEHDYLGEFLSAGAARVVVAVPIEFENHMLYYLDTGKPWLGGLAPTPGSAAYVSIAQELKERTNGKPPSAALDSWRYSLPTNQVILQASPVLDAPPSIP